MGHPEFHAQRVGNTGGGLGRNKNASSTKRDVVMKFYGLPPIGQKQRRPMGGAQFHSPRVGEAGWETEKETEFQLGGALDNLSQTDRTKTAS